MPTATAYYGDLRGSRGGGFARDVAPLFGTAPVEGRKPDAWGAIGIWAWGLSRALDYLAPIPKSMANASPCTATRDSGKTALWAARRMSDSRS